MKNFVFTFALSLVLSAGAFAQSGAQSGTASIDTRVTTVTRNMANELGLNELEYIKLRALNREHFTKQREITSMYSNDMSMRDMKMTELNNAYEAQLNSFLNPKQMEAYASYKENSANYTALTGEE